MSLPKPPARIREADVVELERLAHRARTAMRESGGSVADGYSPTARARLDDLLAALVRVCGMTTAADNARTEWIVTDGPIAELAALHRLTEGARVRAIVGPPRAGRVAAPPLPVGDRDEDPQRPANGPLRVWVAYPGRPEPVLEPAAALELIR